MSGKGDQVSLKPEGFSVRSNEGKLDDNVPRGGGRAILNMVMASQCPRAASAKTLSTRHKTACPTEMEGARGGGKRGRQTAREGETLPPANPRDRIYTESK